MAKATAKSFSAADDNLEGILHKICRSKWEKEVVEKKAKPHAIGWVFA